MILQAAILAILSVASPVVQAPAQATPWETYLLEQVTTEKISTQEYAELLKQFVVPTNPAPGGSQTTWLLSAIGAILILEVRLRKFLSTLLRGVLENMKPFFKDVLKEALEDKENNRHE